MNVPLAQLAQPEHTVSFFPPHARDVYCPVAQAAQAVQAQALPTYCPLVQPVRGHPPHTVSLTREHAVVVKVPLPQTLQFLHWASEAPVHGLEAYWFAPHTIQLLHAHALVAYWLAGHPVSRHGPHTVSCTEEHAAFANVPFPHTLQALHTTSLYAPHAGLAYWLGPQVLHGEHTVSCVSEHWAVWNVPPAQMVQSRFTASRFAAQGLAWYCHAPGRVQSVHTVGWLPVQVLEM